MLAYHTTTALRSLRRSPILTALLIGAIAIGICISTTVLTVRHLFAKDPIPTKSEKLFYVRLDNWDPARPYPGDDPKSLPPQVTYRDMKELMKSKIPVRQTGTYRGRVVVYPDPKVGRPYQENVRLTYKDFFEMFEVPFEHGRGWDAQADAKPEAVIVLSAAANDRLFGGRNSVGQNVKIDDRQFRVIGVLKNWRPSINYYDLTQGSIQPPDTMFIPFEMIRSMQIRPSGNTDAWKSIGNTFEENLASELNFIQMWAELRSPADRAAYTDFVNSYVMEQKKLGRFGRPLNNRIVSLLELIDEWKIVPPQANAMSAVAILFLAVCSLNLMGLLLGKFLARSPEISVRRALGATKAQVFMQHIVECELIGVVGGVIGMALSVGTLAFINKVLPNGARADLDLTMISVAVFLSLVAGLVAGLYPSWRVCRLAPAMQLKIQ